MHPSNLNILKFDIENDGILNILLTFGGSAYDRLKTGPPLYAYVQCMSYRNSHENHHRQNLSSNDQILVSDRQTDGQAQ